MAGSIEHAELNEEPGPIRLLGCRSALRLSQI